MIYMNSKTSNFIQIDSKQFQIRINNVDNGYKCPLNNSQKYNFNYLPAKNNLLNFKFKFKYKVGQIIM